MVIYIYIYIYTYIYIYIYIYAYVAHDRLSAPLGRAQFMGGGLTMVSSGYNTILCYSIIDYSSLHVISHSMS